MSSHQKFGPSTRVLLTAGMIQGGRSGVGRYVVELANRLAEYPVIQLHVAGLSADRHLFPHIPDSRWITIPALYRSGPLNLFWHQVNLRTILMGFGYDLFHAPSYRRIMGCCPVSQIATIHDCAPFRLRDKYGSLRGFFGRSVVPRLARRCDQVLTVSEFTKADLVTYFQLQKDEVEVIYNGLDHQRLKPQGDKEISAFRSNKQLDAPYLLYISRIEHPGKNHMNLIEAYELLRKRHAERILLILAGAKWHGAEVIEERVAKSPYKSDIRMPGFIDDTELPLWYGAAEALIFPSFIEGFGLPVAEAMACGTAVACSDRGSLPEVGGSAAVYFNPDDPILISNAIEQLLADDVSSSSARRSASLQNAARFDWDRAAQATCNAYLRCLGQTKVSIQ